MMPDDVLTRHAAASILRQLYPDCGRVRVLEVSEQPNGSADVLAQTRSMPGRPAGRPFWLNLSAAERGGVSQEAS